MNRTSFTTTTRGLDLNHPAMRLYEKAKRLGIWNPSDIDFSQDIRDWQSLNDLQHDAILQLATMFQGGEEAVTLDLLPLIMVIAEEGRVEEEIFLTTFLFEEAKHTDFFHRFIQEVTQAPVDLSKYLRSNYHKVFNEALPQALNNLRTDHSPAAQVRASVTYNLIVEGVLAETGYHAFYSMLERNNLMPGVRTGVTLLKQDESRHIAYGIYLLSRLIAADGSLWETLETHMNALLPEALGVVSEIFECYEEMPFGLQAEDFTSYAMQQFGLRFERLEKARTTSLSEIESQSIE